MKNINLEIKSKEEAKAYIESCEADFDFKLRQAAKRAAESDCRIITLSGPTCSGKTTTARLLEEEIERSRHNAVVLSIDDFYRDNIRSSTPEGQTPDFDSASTIDLDYLEVFLSALRRGERVMVPKFDFTTGVRVSYSELIPEERDVFVIEGIQAVYPEVVPLFGDCSTGIFVCVEDDVCFNGVEFASSEIRLFRRTVRDFKFRNATPAFTLECWDSVRANEEKNIFPNTGNTDVFIDSFLPYELPVIAKYAIPLYETVTVSDRGYDMAQKLLKKLKQVTCDFFEPRHIPRDSMFREFIGHENS